MRSDAIKKGLARAPHRSLLKADGLTDEEIERILPDLTFDKNQDIYGVSVEELFARSGHNWAHVPRDWDAPCKINFHNLRTGHAFSSGRLGYDTLERSFLGI